MPLKIYLAEINIPYAFFRKVYNKYRQEVCIGKMTANQLFAKYKEELDFIYPIDDFNEYWFSKAQPILEIHQLAKDLAERYQLGIISNAYLGSKEQILKRALIPQLNFKPAFYSCEMGMAKPDRNLYLLAEEKAGVEPSEIFYIDNVSKYVDLARVLGWEGFVFDSDNVEKSVGELRRILL